MGTRAFWRMLGGVCNHNSIFEYAERSISILGMAKPLKSYKRLDGSRSLVFYTSTSNLFL